MEPSNTKVPILRLPALPSVSNKPISPSQLITSYLGVPLNPSSCYLSVCLSDAVCYIWSRRLKESEDISLCNIAQTKLFKKVIRILRNDKPLESLSEVSNEVRSVKIRYENPPERIVIKKMERKAELVAAIFNERMVEEQAPLIRCYRDLLAGVLEWHVKEFFKEELIYPLKATTSSPTILEEFGDPSIKTSPGGRMIKRMSQHPLMPCDWEAKLAPTEKKTFAHAIKDLSMDHLYYCQTLWLFERAVEDAELLSLNLDVKQMGILTEEQIARNISFELDGGKLAIDIDRTIQRISINICTNATFLKNAASNKGVWKNINHASRFTDLIANLMIGLKVSHKTKTEILETWNRQVLKEGANQNNELFSDALTQFFNKDLIDQTDIDKRKLWQLLILMRQRMYVHPMLTIKAALTMNQISLQIENDHQSRQMAFQFAENTVEYQVSSFASISKENLKKDKELPPFELEMLNVMRAPLDNLDTWSSNITITIRALGKKKELIEEKVLKPLRDLGFIVIII